MSRLRASGGEVGPFGAGDEALHGLSQFDLRLVTARVELPAAKGMEML